MNEKHLRMQKLDDDGQPLKNKFGHENSPLLTDNEIAYVEAKLAEGVSIQSLMDELETTRGRITQIRDNAEAQVRIMRYRETTVVPQKIDQLMQFVLQLSEQVDELTAIQSKLLTDSRKMNKALYLKQIGEAKKRKEIRNLKLEREELRKLLHKQAGIDVGAYKRDVD